MATVGDIVVNLTANTRAFSSGLFGAVGVVRNALFRIENVVTGALGGLTFAKMVHDAEIAQREMRKLEAVITATGGAVGLTVDEIAEFANARQKITDFGDEATKSAASILASFQTIQGPAFLRTLELAQDLATVMGTDLNSATKMLGLALASPAEGLSRLSRAGVIFTQDQKNLIKSMVESGDAAGAQSLLLDALAGKIGGAAQAASSPVNRLKNALGDLSEVGGAVLLPTVELITEALAGQTMEFNENATEAERFGNELASGVVPVLADVAGAVEVVIGVFSALQATLSATIATIARMRLISAELAEKLGLDFLGEAEFLRNLIEEEDRTQQRLLNRANNLVFGEGVGKQITKALDDARKRLDERPKPKEVAGLLDPDAFDEDVESAADDAFKRAQQLFDMTQTPIERAMQDLKDAEDAFAFGELPAFVVERMQERLWDEIRKTIPEAPEIPEEEALDLGGVARGTPALLRGSRDAFSAIQAAIRQGNNQPVNKIAANTQVTAQHAPQQTNALQQINNQLQNIQVFGP